MKKNQIDIKTKMIGLSVIGLIVSLVILFLSLRIPYDINPVSDKK